MCVYMSIYTYTYVYTYMYVYLYTMTGQVLIGAGPPKHNHVAHCMLSTIYCVAYLCGSLLSPTLHSVPCTKHHIPYIVPTIHYEPHVMSLGPLPSATKPQAKILPAPPEVRQTEGRRPGHAPRATRLEDGGRVAPGKSPALPV